jgi:hypothetical protein
MTCITPLTILFQVIYIERVVLMLYHILGNLALNAKAGATFLNLFPEEVYFHITSFSYCLARATLCTIRCLTM